VKFKKILPLAGVLTLLAGAAFAQANIPAGAGAGTYRAAPGAPVGGAVNPRPAAPPAAAPAADAARQSISKTCSEQANEQGLHGKARKSFRAKCKRNGGR
jgi:hypothetical protein